MVRNKPTVPTTAPPTTAREQPSTLDKQAPEDSAMKKGLFQENNTLPPKEERVLKLFSLAHKTAVISGSDRGIGLSVAKAFAEAGANVAIWYHSNEQAHQRAKEIEEVYGVKCKAYKVDATDFDSAREVLEKSVSDLGARLDVFVANAGIPWTQGRMIDGEVSHYRAVVSTDLDSVFFCAKAAGAIFRRQYESGVDMTGQKLQHYSYGSFIATSSMSGHIANIPQLQAAYNAAKAGVRHLCKSLAVEWVKFARVNSISPGYIATEISDFIPPETKAIWHSKTPMGREGQPAELKGAYLYLASDASSYTTGTDITVDGGYTIV